MLTLLAGGFDGLAKWAVIVITLAAIVFLACQVMKVAIPGWLIQLIWIVVAAVVCIAAINFVAGL